MRIVTTCHRDGYKQYGGKALKYLRYWPAKVHWYTEGFDLPKKDTVEEHKTEDLPRLQQFKAKWKSYRPPDWRYDVVRFSNKVYVAHDALRDYDGLGIWMDADIIASKEIPEDYLRSLLPDGCYMALFQRDGMHSETGLWLADCSHPAHKAFMDTLLGWYEQGTFRDAHEWHDCIFMDATVKHFQKQGVQFHNLSGARSKTSHPMAGHPIAKYIDHLKGPMRKALGKSPERKTFD